MDTKNRATAFINLGLGFGYEETHGELVLSQSACYSSTVRAECWCVNHSWKFKNDLGDHFTELRLHDYSNRGRLSVGRDTIALLLANSIMV